LARRWQVPEQEVPGMDMQNRDRELSEEYGRRVEELERERIESIERTEPAPDPDMAGVPVEPAEPGTDPRLGGAVVGGALGAVAGAIVGGPAGAIVGGAVGAAGGAVVAGGESVDASLDDRIVDIDRPDLGSDVRRPRDEDIDVRM
jgi:hypothetical protein